MSKKTISLNDNLYNYLLSVSLREPAVLKELRAETATLSTSRMQISPEQGQFMGLLIELMGAKKTLDIGVYTGYSSLVVALALPSEGCVVACDINTEWTQIAKKYWRQAQVEQKITLHIAPALQTMEQLISNHEENTFDFAFIDADKENYPLYYEKALILLRPGGLILVDNTLWDGAVADPTIQNKSTQNIRNFNEKLYHDERVTLSLLPLGDGLTLARKRVLSRSN